VRATPRRAARGAACLALIATLLAMLGACSSRNDPGPPVNPPAPTPNPTAADRAAALVAKLTDPELVGQVLMPSVSPGAPAEQSAKLVADFQLGGLILMGDVQNTAGRRHRGPGVRARSPTRCGQPGQWSRARNRLRC
jgi:beta-N-acetylhexosaminidase